jgi:DNA-binding MarR family transcriptional regulator
MATSDREPRPGRPHADVTDQEIDALLTACRALVAIAVHSVSAVSEDVDLVQLRILVVIASRGWASLGEVAEATTITPSKASRTCDRLVANRLVTRDDDPNDRRSLKLTLTRAGQQVVRRVNEARRDAIAPMLAAMPASRRSALVRALDEFTANSTPEQRDLWAMGWAT